MACSDKQQQEQCIKMDAAGQKGAAADGVPLLVAGLPTPARNGRREPAAADRSSRAQTSPLEEVMRRQGVDAAWDALEDSQRTGATADKYTICRMLTKTVGEGRGKQNPARIYRCIGLVERFVEMQPNDVDEVLFNAVLDTCCRLKDLKRLEATMAKMRELNVTPSPVTLGVLVKTYGQVGDLQKVLRVWDEMEKQRGQANAVTYGCMIDACVKCGNLQKAVEIFDGMRQSGKHRNTILYTTLIKGYGSEKDLQSALRLFREMPREGVQYNTITYNSVLDACVKCGDLATAEGLLQEMTSSQNAVEPDLITFSTLLKGYCHLGDLDRALQVAEAIKARGLRCDELVYNTLMDGCVKAGDYSAGIGLFEEMVQTGMRPSAITHSILARLYQRAGYEGDAPEALAQLYQQVGVERPALLPRGAGKGNGRRDSKASSSAQSARGDASSWQAWGNGMSQQGNSSSSSAQVCQAGAFPQGVAVAGMPYRQGCPDQVYGFAPLGAYAQVWQQQPQNCAFPADGGFSMGCCDGSYAAGCQGMQMQQGMVNNCAPQQQQQQQQQAVLVPCAFPANGAVQQQAPMQWIQQDGNGMQYGTPMPTQAFFFPMA